MDARFQELAETDEQKSVSKRRAGFGAYAVLFLSTFFGCYAGFRIALECFLAEFSYGYALTWSKIILIVGSPVLGTCSGRPAIVFYRMRNSVLVGFLTFCSILSAVVAVAWPWIGPILEEPDMGWGLLIFIGAPVFFVLEIVVNAAQWTVLRARYAYSEKTGQWLRCHASEKRLLASADKPDPETIEEVLLLEAAPKKSFFSPQLALFLDSEPDGEHYLWFSIPPKKVKFLSWKSSAEQRADSITLPVDSEQIEQLRARFGGFKKTFFIPAISAKAGDAIRRRLTKPLRQI